MLRGALIWKPIEKQSKSVKGERTTMSEADKNELVRHARLLGWVAATGAVVVVVVACFADARFVFSAAFAAFVAVVNLAVLAKVVAALLNGKTKRTLWGLVGLGKLLVLGLVLFFAFSKGYCDPLGFAVGYAALPLGVTLAQTTGALEHPTAG